MKLINLTSFLIVFLIAAACNSSKDAAAAQETIEPVETPPQSGPQGQRGPRQQDPEWQAKYDAMLTSLDMTEKQKEDFDFINQKYRAQMQQIRQNAGEDRMAMRSQMMELRTKQSEELKGVFTETQYTTYEKWMQENRRGRRGGGNRGGNG